MFAVTEADLSSWAPVQGLVALYLAIAITVIVVGRRNGAGWIAAAPVGIEKITTIPGWAIVMAGTSWWALLVAGIGFYNDVAWHVALGRDKELLTAPHTMIVIGLAGLAGAGLMGVLAATVTDHPSVNLRVGRLRVPWSSIPLLLLGFTALGGFPLDELWHGQYGIDVTMWSPTHMLMILGAAFSGMCGLLAFFEARVVASSGPWHRAAALFGCFLWLSGLVAPLGEFSFGVPQFQQLFMPTILCLAAGLGLVVSRLVLGPWWTLAMVAAQVGSSFAQSGQEASTEVFTRPVGILIGSALCVEIVARLVGTDRRLRFAIVSGVAVSTAGLAVEWAWNAGAHQPWKPALMVPAVLLGTLVGVAGSVLAVAVVGAASTGRTGLHRGLVIGAGVAVVVGLAIPMPRTVGRASVVVDIDPATLSIEGRSVRAGTLDVQVTPADAADDNKWFQAMAWQGGGLVLAELREVSPGRWRTTEPVPLSGRWKTMLRLHKGSDLMATPLWLPADPEIGARQVRITEGRSVALRGEQSILMREVRPGPMGFAYGIYGLLAVVACLWVAAFALAASRVGPRPAGAAGGRPPRARPAKSAPAVAPA